MFKLCNKLSFVPKVLEQKHLYQILYSFETFCNLNHLLLPQQKQQKPAKVDLPKPPESKVEPKVGPANESKSPKPPVAAAQSKIPQSQNPAKSGTASGPSPASKGTSPKTAKAPEAPASSLLNIRNSHVEVKPAGSTASKPAGSKAAAAATTQTKNAPTVANPSDKVQAIQTNGQVVVNGAAKNSAQKKPSNGKNGQNNSAPPK